MLNRLIILLFVTIITVPSISQTTNVLKLKNKKHYLEENTVLSDSVILFTNQVCYNDPHTIDEEGCFILKLVLTDTTKAKQLKKIDIIKDSSIIKCVYEYQSVWNWDHEKMIITGDVEFLEVTKKTITVSLNIKVIDYRKNRIYLYIGNRKFSCQSLPLPTKSKNPK